MLYRFEKDWVNTYFCVVEADSLEEAKQKAEEADWKDLYNESDCARYWGFQACLDEGEECPTLEEYEDGDDDFDWDELDKDDDFFNYFR